ncbi:hypothetical protein BJV77DRAFT_1069406 [Russula vinacea]|nr:hypothetical protein BJV77DRAFT_1069406 [Russula vinacea]
MPSSLATQLAQTASLNSALLVDRARRKPTQSYLFTGREADKHDLESIHAFALNAFIQLRQWNPAIQKYESALFSDAAKGLDRTLLPDLTELPTGRLLEWLVRRFRINEFNVEDVLSLFLPYYDTPHFAKMVTILHIKPDAPWGFLNAYKSAAQTLFEYISRAKALDDAALVVLLPSMLEPLQESAIRADALTKDITLSSYVLLSALSQKCVLQNTAVKVILDAMASCSSRVAPQQFVNAALSVLSPQDQIDDLPGLFIQTILGLPDVNEIILRTMLWSGFERLINPMIPSLIDRIEQSTAFSILESLVSSGNLPNDVLKSITTLSISAALKSNSPPTTNLHRLLASLQQRHPNIVEGVSRLGMDENEGQEEAIEHLLLSLSVKAPHPGETAGLDMVVASMDVNGVTRAAAVQGMLRTLRESPGIDSETLESLRSAFVARVHDTSIEVLKALYSEPSVLLPVLLSDTAAFIQAVSEAVTAKPSQTSRAILRVHISFLALHFLPAVSQDVVEDAFSRAIFPFLLFSKPKFRTAQAVWEIVDAAQKSAPESGLARCESLEGCVEIVKDEERQFQKAKARKDKSVPSAFDNPDVMRRIDLAVASRMAEIILVSNKHDKLLESLLQRLSCPDPHARNLAYLVTRALLGILSGENQIDAAQRVLDAMAITTFEDMDGFVKGADALHEFLNDTSLGNNVVLKPQSRNTLHWLQTSLLCMIPTVPRPSGSSELHRFSASEDAGLRRIALSHAFAFVAAHEATETVIDFQTVLPALLVAFGDPDRGVRHQAAECVQLITRLSKAKQASGVYAFDAIYEKSNSRLKYLSWEDYQKYTEAIVTYREHCVHDSNYIRVVHHQYLARDPSDKKKQIMHKRRIAEYLLSHVVSCGLPTVKLFLVTLLEQERASDLEKLFGPQFEEFAAITVSSLDLSVFYFEPGKYLSSHCVESLVLFFLGSFTLPREALSKNLQSGLFSRLSLDRQTEMCKLIITIGAGSADAKPYCVSLLAKLLSGSQLLIQLVTELRPTPKDTPGRTTKRAKVAEEDVSSAESLEPLAFLAEVLNGIPLPGDKDLISCLLETLSNVSHFEGRPTAGVAYIEQLLMLCIQNASAAAQVAGETSFTGIRMDILVDIIRASESPQTFHQALLLIASLARVAPNFRVVQKTIDSIIPLMVSSLKEKHDSRESLLLASKDFLRVFTDATNHVPRHRRTQFFIHLVDTSDSLDFKVVIFARLLRFHFPYYSIPPNIQLPVLIEILNEAQRLIIGLISPDYMNAGSILLGESHDDEQGSQLLPHIKRRAHALVIFTAAAFEGHYPPRTQTLEAQQACFCFTGDFKFPEYSKVHKSMHATHFVASIANILKDGNPDERVSRGVLAETLDVFVDKLPSVSRSIREETSSNVVTIVSEIKRLLPVGDEGLVGAALRALKAVGSSIVPGEEGSSWIACRWSSLLRETIGLLLPELLRCLLCDMVFISCAQAGEHMVGYFELLRRSLRAASRPPVLEHIRPAFKVFLEGLDLRNKRRDIDIPKVEGAVVAAFVELVAKLNDAAFRPLFRKLFDWAFAVPESSAERKIAFCNAYIGLLDYFKSLMTPYLSFLLSPFVEQLRGSDNREEGSFGPTELCVVQTLTKSLDVDEGAFWRDDRLQQVVPVLVALIAPAGQDADAPSSTSAGAGGREAVSAGLVALSDAAMDDALLKRLNLDVLMHTRADDALVASLRCRFVSETATFIAECAEDEHDGVVSETHALKAVVEGATGERIGGL